MALLSPWRTLLQYAQISDRQKISFTLMTIMIYICFLICLWIIISIFRQSADIFSPARVFGFVWCFGLGLAELKLSRLQHEWSLESWVQLLIGPAAFLLGTFIMYILNINSKIIPLNKMRKEWNLKTINNHALLGCIVFLFSLFVAAYIVLVLAGREIPLFSAQPGQARKEFQLFGVGLVINSVVIIISLTVLYCITETNKINSKIFLIFISLITFILYAMTLQRLDLFTTIIVSFVLIYYLKERIRLSTTFIYSLIILAIFLLSSVRSGLTYSYILFVTSKMRVSPYWAVITEPYMYIVMNLEMFVHSINRLDHFTYGYYTFDFVTALTGLKHWLSSYFNLNETPYLYSPYNTYTAFWTYYRDFGILGVFLIGLLGGSGISALYYSLRKKPQYPSLMLYCYSVYIMLLSIFNSQIGFLWILYEVGLSYLIVYFISKNNKPNNAYSHCP
jgi:oligosaccharide repeat unit polymerase